MILKTIEGISGTRKVLVNVGRSFNLTPAQQFWKILFPAALPTIFVGVRLGLIFALINIVGTEFLINFGGLGQLIEDLAERYDLAGTYAAICLRHSGERGVLHGAGKGRAMAETGRLKPRSAGPADKPGDAAARGHHPRRAGDMGIPRPFRLALPRRGALAAGDRARLARSALATADYYRNLGVTAGGDRRRAC